MVLFRSIAQQLLRTALSITVILLLIVIVNQFVHYLDDAARGQITLHAVIALMGLQVPLLLGYLLPLAYFLSVLIVYGRLYADQEMTVLHACGVPPALLLRYALYVGVGLTLLVGALMLYVEPMVQGIRTDILDRAVMHVSLDKMVPGRFQSLRSGQVLYAGAVKRSDHSMRAVFLADRQGNAWDIVQAKRAEIRLLPKLGGPFVVFHEGARYVGMPGERAFKVVDFKRYGVRLPKPTVHLSDWPNEVPTAELFALQKTESNPGRLHQISAMLHWRFALPISILLLGVLAFKLSYVPPRAGKFRRLLPAFLIYVVYVDCLFLGRAWIQKGSVSGVLGLWWVHGGLLTVLCLLYGWRFLRSRFFLLIRWRADAVN